MHYRDMWRILVFLTGGLGLFLVAILIMAIGFSETPWQAVVFGGICGLIFYFIAREYKKGQGDRNRRWVEKYNKKQQQKELEMQGKKKKHRK